MRSLGAACTVFLIAVLSTHGQESDLMRLTVPAGQLPAGCRLNSTEGAPVRSNPAIVTDPQFLGQMHTLVFDPRGGGTPRVVEATRAEQVEAGYAASYGEEGGFHEIGVFALRLKSPPTGALIPDDARTVRIARGSVVILTWVDGRRASPDVGCVDVIRRHIASVDLK